MRKKGMRGGKTVAKKVMGMKAGKKVAKKKMRMGGSTSRGSTSRASMPTGGRTRYETPAAMAFKKNYPGLSKRLGMKAGKKVAKKKK